MSLKGKAAAVGIGELKPMKEPGNHTALELMSKVSAEAIADAGLETKDIRLCTSPMACHAIHFMISLGKNSGAAREARIDQPYHSDHLARHFLLRIVIGREIAFHMTIGALHSQRLIEVLHDEANIGVRGEEFQVLRGRRRSRAAATRLLS